MTSPKEDLVGEAEWYERSMVGVCGRTVMVNGHHQPEEHRHDIQSEVTDSFFIALYGSYGT